MAHLISILFVLSGYLVPTLHARNGLGRIEDLPMWLDFRPNWRMDEINKIEHDAFEKCSKQHDLKAHWKKYDEFLKQRGLTRKQSRQNKEVLAVHAQYMEKQEIIGQKRSACTTELSRDAESMRKEAPEVFRIPTYKNPDTNVDPSGEIIVRHIKNENEEFWSYSYQPSRQKNSVELKLDETSDGFYGSNLHTISQISGDWIQLPKRPFQEPVWINWTSVFKSKPEYQKLDKTVYTLKGFEASQLTNSQARKFVKENIVLVGAAGEMVFFRLEHPSDMSCGEETSSLDTTKAIYFKMKKSQLFDPDGHLKIRTKYSKGC